MGEWVEVAGPDGAFKAYVARPSGTPKGAVIAIQEIFMSIAQERSYLVKKNKAKMPVQRAIAMDPSKGALHFLLVFPWQFRGATALYLEDQEVEPFLPSAKLSLDSV